MIRLLVWELKYQRPLLLSSLVLVIGVAIFFQAAGNDSQVGLFFNPVYWGLDSGVQIEMFNSVFAAFVISFLALVLRLFAFFGARRDRQHLQLPVSPAAAAAARFAVFAVYWIGVAAALGMVKIIFSGFLLFSWNIWPFITVSGVIMGLAALGFLLWDSLFVRLGKRNLFNLDRNILPVGLFAVLYLLSSLVFWGADLALGYQVMKPFRSKFRQMLFSPEGSILVMAAAVIIVLIGIRMFSLRRSYLE